MAGDPTRERRSAARLRQRLWGAAVLIALGVIGLPLLLDGAGSESRFRRVERLREEPPRLVVAGERDAAPAGVREGGRGGEPGRAAEPTLQAATEELARDGVSSEAARGEVANRGSPDRDDGPSEARGEEGQALRAWVVQAGSFSEQENALVVRDRLREAGFPSFVTDTSAARGAAGAPLFRVQVGPMVDREWALEARERVVTLLGREAIVVTYP